MPHTRKDRPRRLGLCLLAAGVLAAAAPGPAHAQEYSLFDRFSFALEGSWANLDTRIRLDSKQLEVGTEIHFENQGGLVDNTVVPSLAFDWRIGRRHRLGGWWLDVDRDNTTQILTEIRFGDVVFPIDEEVTFSFGQEELGLAYTYFLTLKERLAFGVGGGLRTLKVDAGLAARDLEISEEGDFTGPLPFVWVEVRYGLARKLRLVSNLGLFYIEIGDYTGSQLVLDAYFEHLTFKNLSFGGGLRGGQVDVDVNTSDYAGAVKIGIVSLRVFARVRF